MGGRDYDMTTYIEQETGPKLQVSACLLQALLALGSQMDNDVGHPGHLLLTCVGAY